jgi:hypothetical protein
VALVAATAALLAARLLLVRVALVLLVRPTVALVVL